MKKLSFDKVYTWLLIVGGIIGLLAASILTVEKLKLAANPNYVPSCSLSPIVACSPVIKSPQASAFGFPNTIIGIAGFAMVWAVGMMLLTGGKVQKKWFWWCFQAGTTFGILFVAWLMHEALYDIGKLCIYCMAVWAVTIPIFWTTLARNLKEKQLTLSKSLDQFFVQNPGKLTVVSYLIVIVLIFARFADYFHTVLW